MYEDLKPGKVVTVWVNQVMYPGAVSSIEGTVLRMDSIQHKGLRYVISIGAITALTIDENSDSVEKLEAQKKAFEEKAKAMREEAEELERQEANQG